LITSNTLHTVQRRKKSLSTLLIAITAHCRCAGSCNETRPFLVILWHTQFPPTQTPDDIEWLVSGSLPRGGYKRGVRLHGPVHGQEIGEGLEEDVRCSFAIRYVKQELLKVGALQGRRSDEKHDQVLPTEVFSITFHLGEADIVAKFGFYVRPLSIGQVAVALG